MSQAMERVRLVDLGPESVSFECFPYPRSDGGHTGPSFLVDGVASRTVGSPAVVWARLVDAHLIVEPGLDGVVVVDGRIVWESHRFLRPGLASRGWIDGDGIVTDPREREVAGVFDSAVVCFDPGWTNYYHWLLLVLPGLFQAVREGVPGAVVLPEHSSYDDRRISPAFSAKTRDDTLGRIIGDRAVRFLDPGVYRVGELRYLVPLNRWSPDSITFFDSGIAAPYIEALAPARPAPSAFGSRLLLTRAPGANQRLAGWEEAELRSIGRATGFHEVVLEQLSFDEQWASFAAASAVLGAHGAGLSNLIFGSRVELFEYLNPHGDEPFGRNHFQRLCVQLGHRARVIDRASLTQHRSELVAALAGHAADAIAGTG